MEHISATEAKREFGEVLLKAQQSPVGIDKNGKPVAVMLSADAYAEMTALNRRYLEWVITQGLDDVKSGRTAGEADTLSCLRRLILQADS